MLPGDALRQMFEEQTLPATTRRTFQAPKKIWLLGLVPVVLVVVVLGLHTLFHPQAQPTEAIPAAILSKLNFSPLVPRSGAEFAAKPSSFEYSTEVMQLSFVIYGSSTGSLTIGEQATPQDFIDTPDSYTKLVDSIHRYSVFKSWAGDVYLTRPASQKSGQTAVMNTGDVVIFAQSSRDLSDAQWQHFFAELSVAQQTGSSGR